MSLLSSRRPRSIPRDARMRIVRASLRHTHVNTHRDGSVLFIYLLHASRSYGEGEELHAVVKMHFSSIPPRSKLLSLLTCSTSVMRCLCRNQKYTRVTFIRDRALTRDFSSPARWTSVTTRTSSISAITVCCSLRTMHENLLEISAIMCLPRKVSQFSVTNL